MSSLGAEVRATLRRAVQVYSDSPQAVRWLQAHLTRFDEPLRVAIAGKVKAGKSTLLNALVGEQIAPTDAGECTRVVTWYQDAPAPDVTLYPRVGPPRRLPISRDRGALVVALQGVPAEQIDRLVVDWPSSSLRATTLIDTPGIASLSADTAMRAGAFLTPQDAPTSADAVIYLIRHLHATDLRFLESFQDRGVACASAVNTVAVLSRADEIGAGRIDALLSARRIARRYRDDQQLRRLCQTVVAVAGLLAETGRTLRQAEFTALTELARAPRAEIDQLLLSADRFARPEATGTGVPDAPTRAGLLERFGLFGVRLSTTLIRQGIGDPVRLAAELVRRSGLEDLRTVLTAQFSERRELLKARSALLSLEQVLRREPRPEAIPLATEVERIMAGAHEFVELRLLATLRSGAVRLPEADRIEAERLAGADGGSAAARLGLDPGSTVPELRAAAVTALRSWQRRAENPLSARAVTEVARVVVRSCEGLLAELGRAEQH